MQQVISYSFWRFSVKGFPPDLRNLTSNRAIELAVLNVTKIEKKRKYEDLSAATTDIIGDKNDHEEVIAKYGPVHLL